MLHTLRIGVRIGSNDPYWVQTREAVRRNAQQRAVDLVSIDIDRSAALSSAVQPRVLDELLAQDLDALICTYLPAPLLDAILRHGIPVVHLTETEVRHPLLASARGYYDIAQSAGAFLAARLPGAGLVLMVGGLLAPCGEDGRSRIAGFTDALRQHPRLAVRHIPSAWRYEHAYPQIEAALAATGGPVAAIFGLSDSLALAARDAGRALGRIDGRTLIIGINGDPLALAAVADGSMAATIDTPAAAFGVQAMEIACAAARREPVAPHFGCAPQLVTPQNVAEVAMRKLIAIADLPSQLVGVNRQQEQQRMAQLETSLEINRRVGSILNRRRLSQEIAELIRANYGYDTVHLYLWRERDRHLVLDEPDGCQIPLDEAGPLRSALLGGEPVFVANTRHSQRFAQAPHWPDAQSRVVVPIRQGETVVGLLDLHSRRRMQHTRQSLVGLEALAAQLGIAMRNAELYDEALRALAVAEQADQLKTRLLANVSHELRAPLNAILGFSQAALATPNPYGAELPPELLRDQRLIYRSGQHLDRLINDLLDLSRAEIGELELDPETVDTRVFLEEVFRSAAGCAAGGPVGYELRLPERLPLIEADPLRLRQILLNLLDNARKFTSDGRIELGAEVAPPHLRIWVADSGPGIPAELQERIFEPFVTGGPSDRRAHGAGLGLSIARRLVLLHRGTLALESEPGRGSRFQISLPLPGLDGQASAAPEPGARTLLLIAPGAAPDAAYADLCRRDSLALRRLRPGVDLRALLDEARPAAIVWDLRAAEPAQWQLVERLRGDQRARRLPLLLYGAPPAASPAGAAGAVGLLGKPLSGAGLLATIEALRPPASGPVLIADDDPQTCALYARLAAQALPGLPVRIAENGRRALELLGREVPSLVILDLVMPELDGFTVLERMRADEHTRAVPVVVISGQPLDSGDIRRLDHALVTLHSKGVLEAEETAAALQSALEPRGRLGQQTSLAVKRAVAHIQRHYSSDLSLQQIAAAVGVSKNYLTQIFQHELGLSPWEYLSRYRITQAKLLLQNAQTSIAGVAVQVGFEDASYFSRVFRKHVGCTPKTYRSRQT